MHFLEQGTYNQAGDFAPYQQRTEQLFVETYRTLNYMGYLCTSCTRPERFDKILADLTKKDRERIDQYFVVFQSSFNTFTGKSN